MTQSNNKDRFIVGNGGHSAVVQNILKSQKLEFSIIEKEKSFNESFSERVILENEFFTQLSGVDRCLLFNGVGANPKIELRKMVYEKYTSHGFSFGVLIADSATILGNVELQDGAQIISNATLHPNVIVGENSVVNTGAIVEHDCIIGKNCFISPGSILCGGVTVGDDTFIGSGAIVFPGANIERETIISAGTATK